MYCFFLCIGYWYRIEPEGRRYQIKKKYYEKDHRFGEGDMPSDSLLLIMRHFIFRDTIGHLIDFR